MTNVESQFSVHQETHLYLTEPVYFQITTLKDSAFIWVGHGDGKLGDLSMAVPPFASHSTASSTTLLGKNVADQSRGLASRLALRYKQQFYVTFNLGQSDDLLFVFVEKKLMELLKKIFA
ncbi:hypothetical protein BY458DRAFT_525878 [Sporodiniella umbellata]|nr:hypothetical protein BY458DRAFT_525878 [Sporodiniella umbellata]